MKVEIKIDAAVPAVRAKCSDPDPDHAQQRLDALNANYARTQTELKKLEAKADTPPARTEGYYSGGLYHPGTVEDRSLLIHSIHEDSGTLAMLEKAKPKLEAELEAVVAKTAALGQLDGTVVMLTLPNGVDAAQLTLVKENVKSFAPKPAIPDGRGTTNDAGY